MREESKKRVALCALVVAMTCLTPAYAAGGEAVSPIGPSHQLGASAESTWIKADAATTNTLGVTDWQLVTRNGLESGFIIEGVDASSLVRMQIDYSSSSRGFQVRVSDTAANQSASWAVHNASDADAMAYRIESAGGDKGFALGSGRVATLRMIGAADGAHGSWEIESSDGTFSRGDLATLPDPKHAGGTDVLSFFSDPAVTDARATIQAAFSSVFRDSSLIESRKEYFSPAVTQIFKLAGTEKSGECSQSGSKTGSCYALALPAVFQAYWALGPTAGIACTGFCATALACIPTAAGGGALAATCYGAAASCLSCAGMSVGANLSACLRQVWQEN